MNFTLRKGPKTSTYTFNVELYVLHKDRKLNTLATLATKTVSCSVNTENDELMFPSDDVRVFLLQCSCCKPLRSWLPAGKTIFNPNIGEVMHCNMNNTIFESWSLGGSSPDPRKKMKIKNVREVI